ncbi:hypothetical protein Lal_00013263 [Lupinus albus]|uniref:Uncharacterized protein n=1 Tax=Lupinus albus TaxID=3870 RepID=A0A6A4NZS2_LUPAL|nr:putative protein kinase RLK-Pelle-WAK family [Lupinus albus]KAF1890668.1 hypothetical protein Lal_00013263 [Lupinus albus]
MVLHFTFHIIIFIILPLYSLAADFIIAQPGCDSACGHVSIPYPFGMKDPNCYVDKWFEIECRYDSTYNSGYTPYLKSLNLEVSTLGFNEYIISIWNPIFYSNCDGKSNKPVIDLKGSPFRYSQEMNTFMAYGCSKLAFMQSDGSTIGGCVSICDGSSQTFNNCNGISCCQTSLPLHLSEYNVTLSDLNNISMSDDCNYAFIAYRNAYQYDQNEFNINGLVRAVLEWEIVNDVMSNKSNQLYLNVNHSSNSHCYTSSITSSSQNKTSGWICKCNDGFYGNPYIYGSCASQGTSRKSNHSKKWAIVGVSSGLGSVILLYGLWWTYKAVRRRVIKNRKEKFFKRNGGLLLQQRLSSADISVHKILYTLKDIEKATDNFNTNRVLGKGGQGTVYKGMLVDGKIVAVKKFKVQGKVEEFINEFAVLSQINHRNVVKLLGCCLETKIPLLVYEFIPNGNLFEYLHVHNEELPVTWDIRLRIAKEIAGALFYLHSIASQPIYHRDIKSTNILLDEKYRAKVADFGTSRVVSIEATHLTTVVQGTFGYLDPEYFHTSQFTDKSDVYSFGVVLAELLTGKKPISLLNCEEARNLASYFVLSMEENQLFEIIDKRVADEAQKEQITAVANLAFTCLELNGRKRPNMKEVTLELERIQGQDRRFSAKQNHEELELARTEDNQSFDGYSMSNTLSIINSETDVMPILKSNSS